MPRETQELAYQIATDALSHPPQSRAAFVLEKCGADSQLRRLVDERIGSLVLGGQITLEVKPEHYSPTMAPSLQVGTVSFVGTGDHVGEQIGPYRILSVLGEGGFGTVYLAEQSEPVKRQVAIKVLKPGMDSRQIIARFEAERQALAMMDHAAIAKVFDAGTTLSGRPFFVMELVKGEPITRHCDGRKLPMRDRLRLFVQVCRAVQHAHHKGIIHRDIKPSNVLVALDDGVAGPKVIDFGIAKAVGRSLTEKTIVTEMHQLIGTPEYMSPEQAESDGLDLDTRTDVYSLGVLLYELLTGTTPFDGAQLRSAAYWELQRIMREVEPPRPSTRLSTLAGKLTPGPEPLDSDHTRALSSEDVARLRDTSPAQLLRLVRGELDWIVMKAIDKDRARRYDSAAALAADVERFLANEPVQARPPSAAYRLSKFAARNRVAVFAGSLVLLSLVGAMVATVVSYVNVRTERDSAVAARTREAEARKVAEQSVLFAHAADKFFLERILGSALPDVSLGQDLTVLQVVDQAAAQVGSIKEPAVRAQVHEWLGRAFLSLGRTQEAREHLQQAEKLAAEISGPDSENAVRARFELGQALAKAGETQHAADLFAAAEGRWRELHGSEHPHVAWAMHQRADALARLGKSREAATLAEGAVAIYRALGPAAPADQLAMSLNLQATLFEQSGQSARAVEILTESLDLQRDGAAPATLGASTRIQLANALVSTGQVEEAVSLIEEALLLRERILPPGHEQIAQAKAALARAYFAAGTYARAAGQAREAADIFRTTLGPTHEFTATATSTLGAALHKMGRYPEAAAAFADSIKAYASTLGEEDWRTCNAKVQYAACLLKQDRLADAELHLLAAERALAKSGDAPAVHRAALQGLVALYTLKNQPETAQKWADQLGPPKNN